MPGGGQLGVAVDRLVGDPVQGAVVRGLDLPAEGLAGAKTYERIGVGARRRRSQDEGGAVSDVAAEAATSSAERS